MIYTHIVNIIDMFKEHIVNIIDKFKEHIVNIIINLSNTHKININFIYPYILLTNLICNFIILNYKTKLNSTLVKFQYIKNFVFFVDYVLISFYKM
jgi:hypothetical protein